MAEARTILAGPGDKTGGAVGKVTGIAREVLGTDHSSSIEAAIARDPNVALQFKMAVIQAEADASRQEFEALKIQLADVQNARSQTVSLAQAGSPIAWAPVVVSVIVLVGFAAMLWLAIREEVPVNQRDMFTLLLGTLAGVASSVVAYWDAHRVVRCKRMRLWKKRWRRNRRAVGITIAGTRL